MKKIMIAALAISLALTSTISVMAQDKEKTQQGPCKDKCKDGKCEKGQCKKSDMKGCCKKG